MKNGSNMVYLNTCINFALLFFYRIAMTQYAPFVNPHPDSSNWNVKAHLIRLFDVQTTKTSGNIWEMIFLI